MSAPVGHTCPDIDAVQNVIKSTVRDLERAAKRTEDDDARDAMERAATDLGWDIPDKMEELRKANDALRQWGETNEKYAERADAEIDSLRARLADAEDHERRMVDIAERQRDDARIDHSRAEAEVRRLTARIAEVERERDEVQRLRNAELYPVDSDSMVVRLALAESRATAADGRVRERDALLLDCRAMLDHLIRLRPGRVAEYPGPESGWRDTPEARAQAESVAVARGTAAALADNAGRDQDRDDYKALRARIGAALGEV